MLIEIKVYYLNIDAQDRHEILRIEHDDNDLEIRRKWLRPEDVLGVTESDNPGECIIDTLLGEFLCPGEAEDVAAEITRQTKNLQNGFIGLQ